MAQSGKRQYFFRKIGCLPSGPPAEQGSNLFSSFSTLAVEKLWLTLILESLKGGWGRVPLSTWQTEEK